MRPDGWTTRGCTGNARWKFLASGEADWITGQVLVIDGGFSWS